MYYKLFIFLCVINDNILLLKPIIHTYIYIQTDNTRYLRIQWTNEIFRFSEILNYS